MRESSQKKTETRQRILDSAGALFRRYGIDGVGVDAIMHEAGLTHGGFYAHFSSKEALVAEVAAASLTRSAAKWEQMSSEPDRAAAFARIVGPYLDQRHVSVVESGCVLPSLGPEVARRPEARQPITRALHRMVDALERCRPDLSRERALSALCCMVGAVMLARVSDDADLAAAFLNAAKDEIAGQEN